MKVLCPLCDRLGELDQFRFEGDLLVVTCSKCGAQTPVQASADPAQARVTAEPATSRPSPTPQRLSSSPGASNVVLLKNVNTEAVESAARSARTDPFEVPAGLCPKCLAKRNERDTECPQCGLVFARFDAQTVTPPQWLAEAWRALLLEWGDENQHDKLRKKAVQAEGLPAIGRLYRLRLASMAQDPYAQRGRDEVLRLAAVPVRVSSPGSDGELTGETARSRFLPIIAFLVFLLVISVMAIRFIIAARSDS